MSRPLVSVSGVFESETVHTTQRTRAGAWALCSSTGERAASAAAGLRHGGGRSAAAYARSSTSTTWSTSTSRPRARRPAGQLEDAARVRRHHGRRRPWPRRGPPCARGAAAPSRARSGCRCPPSRSTSRPRRAPPARARARPAGARAARSGPAARAPGDTGRGTSPAAGAARAASPAGARARNSVTSTTFRAKAAARPAHAGSPAGGVRRPSCGRRTRRR